MKTGALAFLAIIFASLAIAGPPDRGGVMLGVDSSMVLYWTHPDINCYEQGYDDGSESSWLVGGEDSGSYAMAVEFRVPFMAHLESIRIRLSLIDYCVGQPGDQFSPFRALVYAAGFDGRPQEPPLFAENGRLCDGEPCVDEWFDQPLGVSGVTNGEYWQAIQWMDSTPTEPQIIGRRWRPEDPPTLFGFGDENGMTWNDFQYIPAFRQRLLGILPLDTVVAVGWRRRLPAENPPDSFAIFGFLGDTIAAEFVHRSTDTLMCRLVRADFDSIGIHACYDGLVDDSALTVTPDESMSPPIAADIVFPDSKTNPSAMLHMVNLTPEPISLRLAYDNRIVEFDADRAVLNGHETKLISGEIAEPSDDTIDVMVVLTDEENRFYPFVVQSTYPQAGQTDIVHIGNEDTLGYRHPVNIYPNPCFKSMTIADDNFRAVRKITIYNVIGQKVVDISPPFQARTVWNGYDREGRPAPAGIYFVRLRYDAGVVTKTVLLMR